jgi:hypothetical protein
MKSTRLGMRDARGRMRPTAIARNAWQCLLQGGGRVFLHDLSRPVAFMIHDGPATLSKMRDLLMTQEQHRRQSAATTTKELT